MKHLRSAVICCLFVFYCLPILAQPYRVQLAAYVEKVPFKYFSEAHIFGVYMLTDQNNIYRYYIGEFKEKGEADKVVAEAIKKGFKHAHIIDIEEQKKLCGKPCPYFSRGSTYSDETTEVLSLHNVFFGFNQSSLSKAAKSELDRVVNLLRKNPHYEILVSGHTDSKGSAEYNIELSKRRARNSKSYLINKGIKAKRIKAQVFGESVPEVNNNDDRGRDYPKGRKFNRRVVVAVYDPSNGQIIFSRK